MKMTIGAMLTNKSPHLVTDVNDGQRGWLKSQGKQPRLANCSFSCFFCVDNDISHSSKYCLSYMWSPISVGHYWLFITFLYCIICCKKINVFFNKCFLLVLMLHNIEKYPEFRWKISASKLGAMQTAKTRTAGSWTYFTGKGFTTWLWTCSLRVNKCFVASKCIRMVRKE